ncbi:uncharacterized protein PHACADRAFT_184712 [Phanerochaete carnosa HHB-10118-sp]|uniref:Uncharacterized protein n=1 Tax=Phanerochaete carnosa (strain HHB-10118-sp) TaxID=650164 RepID=K5VWQ3_PHACS|nr:uncharacterized protein PHACADRAFT_184712 [Phanerochaete carnosa HHB-10118-sp]EKM55983.1 hypothetical protein PHACADRAFT_184712 [Phanerochaete carnosa HHB-10118-sp]
MDASVELLKQIYRRSETADPAKSYLFFPIKWNQYRKKGKIEYACAYLASEHLQNADILAERAVRRGRFTKSRDFWKMVTDIEIQLVEIAQSSVRASDRKTFNYEPLPCNNPPCNTCERQCFFCIVSRRTTRKRSRGSYKCQVCYLRKSTCRIPKAHVPVYATADDGSSAGEEGGDSGENQLENEVEEAAVNMSGARGGLLEQSSSMRPQGEVHTFVSHGRVLGSFEC